MTRNLRGPLNEGRWILSTDSKSHQANEAPSPVKNLRLTSRASSYSQHVSAEIHVNGLHTYAGKPPNNISITATEHGQRRQVHTQQQEKPTSLYQKFPPWRFAFAIASTLVAYIGTVCNYGTKGFALYVL